MTTVTEKFVYPEWEGERTLDGEDYYLCVVPYEECEGKLDAYLHAMVTRKTLHFGFKDGAEIFPALNDTYSDIPLEGAALSAWLSKYESTVARDVAEIIRDKWEMEYENRQER